MQCKEKLENELFDWRKAVITVIKHGLQRILHGMKLLFADPVLAEGGFFRAGGDALRQLRAVAGCFNGGFPYPYGGLFPVGLGYAALPQTEAQQTAYREHTEDD